MKHIQVSLEDRVCDIMKRALNGEIFYEDKEVIMYDSRGKSLKAMRSLEECGVADLDTLYIVFFAESKPGSWD